MSRNCRPQATVPYGMPKVLDGFEWAVFRSYAKPSKVVVMLTDSSATDYDRRERYVADFKDEDDFVNWVRKSAHEMWSDLTRQIKFEEWLENKAWQ